MRRGVATFTLDNGRCPKWLFERMVKLGREMTDILVAELGPDEFIKRIADPVWFQSLGTVLAFDWNASGLTTILTAALKESIRGRERELGVFICGGKGKTSRKTPEEIKNWGIKLSLPGGVVSNLAYNSRMAAKVDSALIQDGFQIYHHSFFFAFSKKKHPEHVEGPVSRLANARSRQTALEKNNVVWAVVQQGMNQDAGTARRYHWFSENVKDLVCEPHSGITSQINIPSLNMVARNSENSRALSVELANATYSGLMKDIQILRRHASRLSQTLTVGNRQGDLFTVLNLANKEFHHHPVEREEFSRSKYLEKILARVTDRKPESYEKFLAMEGVGPKTVRALALVGEVIYGAKPSYEDPARYSFAFGGKDATPYPVDRPTYDKAISLMHRAVHPELVEWARSELSRTVQKSRLPLGEKSKIIRKLSGNR